MMPIYTCILIAFICAAMNHLGIIKAAEELIGHRVPILNCAKCSTFWFTLVHGISHHGALGHHRYFVYTLATAFAMAYVAIWIELLMGGIDWLYNWIYDEIYPTAADSADNATAAEREKSPGDADADGADSAVSGLQQDIKN